MIYSFHGVNKTLRKDRLDTEYLTFIDVSFNDVQTYVVERQNEKRGLESGFGSAGYVNEI